jgi:iduronate 2-sulfatase
MHFKKNHIMRNLLPLVFLFTAMACQSPEKQKPNILFIMVDDLRPVLGTYGFPDVLTPNIDAMASEGIQFNRSYCNVPVCGASRASLLTGIRPLWPERFRNYLTKADEDVPNAISLPEHFKNSGYTTIGMGKIFHHREDKLNSWSEEHYWPDYYTVIPFMNVDYVDSASLQYINPESGAGPYFEAADVEDSVYFDGMLTVRALHEIDRLVTSDKPFFLAVGYRKPHLPFNAPKKYFDLYDSVETATNRFPIENLPSQVTGSREILTYGRRDHYNTDEFHHEARIAYYACVSMVDAQVGLLRQALRERGLDKNTVIVLIGDHGWHLGEHDFWGKHNTLHNALHSPMIIYSPDIKPRKINQIVEYLDLFPTLCEMAGIDIPDQAEGQSMLALMKNRDKNWKNTLFAEWQGGRCVMTERYSYTSWFEERHKGAKMLFDYETDPLENINVADNPDYKNVVNYHMSLLDSLYLYMKK